MVHASSGARLQAYHTLPEAHRNAAFRLFRIASQTSRYGHLTAKGHQNHPCDRAIDHGAEHHQLSNLRQTLTFFHQLRLVRVLLYVPKAASAHDINDICDAIIPIKTGSWPGPGANSWTIPHLVFKIKGRHFRHRRTTFGPSHFSAAGVMNSIGNHPLHQLSSIPSFILKHRRLSVLYCSEISEESTPANSRQFADII